MDIQPIFRNKQYISMESKIQGQINSKLEIYVDVLLLFLVASDHYQVGLWSAIIASLNTFKKFDIMLSKICNNYNGIFYLF